MRLEINQFIVQKECVFNSEKFSDEMKLGSLDLDGNSPDVVIDEDFTFED